MQAPTQTAKIAPANFPANFKDRHADFLADYTPAQKTNLDFSNAENPLGASPLARDALLKAAAEISHYPSPNAAPLLDAINTHHALSTKNLRAVACAGAGAGILLCVQALLKPGQHVAMPEASFPVALFGATIGHGAGRMVRMGADLSIDLNALYASIDRATSFAFLCNPNNPTGELIAPETIIAFAKTLPCPLVVSEANADYAGVSLLDHQTLPDNLVVVRSFSKIHGLAGLRAGYVVASGKIAAQLERAHCPFTVNHPAQMAAIAALKDSAHVETSRAFMARQRSDITRAITAIGLRVLPSAANTLMVESPPAFPDAARFAAALVNRGITVIDGADFCQAAGRFIRISPRTIAQNDQLIRAIEEMMA